MEASQDSRLSNRLPAEMRDQILNVHLGESRLDWYNCYNACKEFRPDMEYEKVAMLLPAVFQVLEKYEKRGGFAYLYIDEKRIQLDSQDLKNCRLVSHSWRRGVNSYLESHPSHEQVYFPTPLFRGNCYPEDFYLPCAVKNTLSFWDVERMREMVAFLEQERPSLTMFSSRHLVLNDKPVLGQDRPVRECLDALSQLLGHVGAQIWHLTLNFGKVSDDNGEDTGFSFHVLTHVFQQTRNLKTFLLLPGKDTPSGEGFRRPWPRPVVPHLPHLQVIRVPECYGELEYLRNILLANPQVQTVSFTGVSFNGAKFCHNLDSVHLPNLSEGRLSLEGCSSSTILEMLHFVQWPLTRIKLKSPNCNIHLAELLQTLQPFATTVTHLDVGLLQKPKTPVHIGYPFRKLLHLKLTFNSAEEEDPPGKDNGSLSEQVPINFHHPFFNSAKVDVRYGTLDVDYILYE